MRAEPNQRPESRLRGMWRARGRPGLSAWTGAVLLALAIYADAVDSTRADVAPDLAARGEYVLRAAGCVACHTDSENDGALLSGGRAVQTPMGTFYAPNITPDPRHGIGGWSEADLRRALRHGVSPAGEPYYPVFPYPAYTRMVDADIRALKAYLETVPPVAQANRPHELPWYLRYRWTLHLWNLWNFDAGPFAPVPERSERWNRGAYLVTALGHCSECHTPRRWHGGLDRTLDYAGTTSGPDGDGVPNITPDRRTGLGRWKADDIDYFLETGMTPAGDFTGGVMADVVDHGTRFLNPGDRQAIAEFLMTLPAIEHSVRKRDRTPRGEFD